ncbi:MAG: ABC transporter substrate-binding protein [Clostridia bacterium]|nr:ABC transporter substrate-binding protein [Clostridia bacterium]
MKKYLKLAAVLTAVITALSFTGCSSSNKTVADEPETKTEQTESTDGSFPYTFTDIEGREITIEKQPETFIVGNYILNFMLIGGEESLDKVVGMPLDGWEETRFGEYTAMTTSFPEILEKTSIGGYHDDVLDSELILTAKPDVLLINRSQYSENETSIPVFEKAGIKVVVLDYHKMKLENHIKSTEILGVLLGREDVAAEMINDYTSGINLVQERIAAADEEPKTVYVELGSKGVGEYGNSYTGCLWGSIINNAGGINIADSVLDPAEGYGPLDKEYVLTQDPDIIVIGGSIWTGYNTDNDQMRMGLTIDPEMSQERLTGFMNRSGWSSLTAVKNGEVYGVDHGSLRFMGDYIYTEAFAKMIYPDLFEDIDPQAEMEAFYEKYLPELDHTGTFFIKWDKQ